MQQKLRPIVWFFLGPLLLTLVLIQCKKSENTPPSPTPTQEPITPGVTVGLGAQLLDRSTYEKISLLPDPLAGARVAAGAKDPNLPASYDLSVQMPPVGDQGVQGSCVAWAVAYAARSFANKVAKSVPYRNADGSLNPEALLSPAYVYNQVKLGDCQTGSYISSALDLVQSGGVCTLKDMPYTASNCSSAPTADQKQKAASFKIRNWGRVNIHTNTFRRYLYFDYPIIFSSVLDNNFKQLKEKDSSGEYIWKTYDPTSASGGHAMVLVGYDDNRKAFKVQNSWSDRWANKGFIWLSYDLVETAVREAYVMASGDNSALKPPKIQTGIAVKADNGQATMSGIITELGDEPILKYGVCVSSVRELPTVQYEVTNKALSGLPYSFSVTPPLTGTRLYYRVFAQTPTLTVYGDTASITPTQSTTQPTGVGKNLLLCYDGEAYALNADDGSIAWKTTGLAAYGASNNVGGTIAENRFVIGGASPRAFNLLNGQTAWTGQYKAGDYTSYPVVANSTLYNHNGSFLQAYDIRTGTLRWELNASSLGGTIRSNSLAIYNNSPYFITYGDGQYKLLTVDAATGRQSQEIPVSKPTGNPLIVNNSLYVGDAGKNTGGGLQAYSLTNKKTAWTSTGSNGNYPTLVNGLICATNYSWETQTYALVAVDPATGTQKWKYTSPKGYISSGSMSADGNSIAILVITPQSSYLLHLVDAATGSLRWEVDLQAPGFYPLVAESKVYVRTGSVGATTISAYDVSTGKPVWRSPSLGTFSPGPLTLVTAAGKAYYMPTSGMQP